MKKKQIVGFILIAIVLQVYVYYLGTGLAEMDCFSKLAEKCSMQNYFWDGVKFTTIMDVFLVGIVLILT